MLTLEESHAHFTEWFSSQGGPTEMMVVGMWGEEEAEAESEGEMPNTLVITSAVAMLEGALANLFIGQFGAGAPTRVFVHMANVVNDSVEVNTYLTLVTMLIEEKTDFQCEVSAMITRWNPDLEEFVEMSDYDQGRVMYAIEEQRNILVAYMANITSRKLAAKAGTN